MHSWHQNIHVFGEVKRHAFISRVFWLHQTPEDTTRLMCASNRDCAHSVGRFEGADLDHQISVGRCLVVCLFVCVHVCVCVSLSLFRSLSLSLSLGLSLSPFLFILVSFSRVVSLSLLFSLSLSLRLCVSASLRLCVSVSLCLCGCVLIYDVFHRILFTHLTKCQVVLHQQ